MLCIFYHKFLFYLFLNIWTLIFSCFLKYLFIYFIFWLHQVLVVAHGIFVAACGSFVATRRLFSSCGLHAQ